MSSSDAVVHVLAVLERARSYTEIFGPAVAANADGRRKMVDDQFNNLVRLVHPDKVDDASKPDATKAFQILKRARDGARKAIEDGTYERTFAGSVPEEERRTVLKSMSQVYELDGRPFSRGDFSVIYSGATGAGTEVLVKVSAHPTHNQWLIREAEVLGRLDAAGLGESVPRITDTFVAAGDGGQQYRVNVMDLRPGFVSVADLIRMFPSGLDPVHVGWVGRRVLAQVMAAEKVRLVHGAIVPDHVLIEPTKHEVIHIGWAHAVDPTINQKVSHVVTRWKDCYPKEVIRREPATAKTDIAMAGMTIAILLGWNTKKLGLPGAVPKEMVKVIQSCVDPSPGRRFNTGRDAFDEFTRVVRGLWGNQYRPLVLPGKAS